VLTDWCLKNGYTDIDNKFNLEFAQQIASEPRIKRIQTSGDLSEKIWKLVNNEVLEKRDDLQLRIFGYYSGPCDFKFLSKLSGLKSLTADSISESRNIETIGELSNLKYLRLGIDDIKTFEFLKSLGPQLTHLSLRGTKSKRPDLNILENFGNLSSLSIHKHTKNIEIIGSLNKLRELNLAGIKISDFDFVHRLKDLNDFYIDLVSCENISSIEGLKIEKFGISEIRKLTNVDFIGTFLNLRELDISYLNVVEDMKFKLSSDQLRRVSIDGMKLVKSLEFLHGNDALEDFFFRSSPSLLQPDDFIPISKLPNLKIATVGTGNVGKNNVIADIFKSKKIKSLL